MASSWKRLAINRLVVVNLKSGNAVKGVLWQERGELIVIKSATYLEPGREPAKLDGETIIPVVNIDFVQALSEA